MCILICKKGIEYLAKCIAVVHVYNLTDARVIDLSRVNHLKKETFVHSSINEGEKHTCTTTTTREKSTNQTQQNNKTN